MCSALQKEVVELKSVISHLSKNKFSCQHECTVNAVQEEVEKLSEHPDQHVFDQISTDINRLSELTRPIITQKMFY